MRILCAAILTMSAAFSAQAASVSNLDKVEHVVIFEEVPGNQIFRVVKPGHTIQYHSASVRVRLQKTPRANAIAIDGHDKLVIWQNGNLQIQQYRRASGDGVF